MSTIIYRNAQLLVNGSELSGTLHDLGLEYTAETVDGTVMGNDTRVRKGALFTGKLSGKGYFDNAVAIEQIMFSDLGVDDTIVTIFPDGVIEGSVTTGVGYAMKTVIDTFYVGGAVGALLQVNFSAVSRGVATPGIIATP